MGKVYTPPYLIEYRDQQGWHWQCWEHRTARPYNGRGKPSAAKLETWRKEMNLSFQPGEVNSHIGEALGFVPHISRARVVRQRTGEVVAESGMPMFEVI